MPQVLYLTLIKLDTLLVILKKKFIIIAKKNILIEAYSPLATGNLLNDPIISKIAQKYNTSNANICLSYCYLKHTLPLPKSTHKERIVNNINFFVNILLDDIKILDQVHNKELDRPLRS